MCNGIDDDCNVEVDEGVECDDTIACTVDYCDGANGCIHEADNAFCNDQNQCTTDSCHMVTGCSSEPVIGPCEDGEACTINDSCQDGSCVPGEALFCSDNDLCTNDSCDPQTGDCHFEPVFCDDFDTCTTDICDPVNGDCLYEDVDCDDNAVCTIDDCDPLTGICFYTPFCTDLNACTVDFCDPDTAECTNEAIDCENDNPCIDNSCDPLSGCNTVPVENGTTCSEYNTCVDGNCDCKYWQAVIGGAGDEGFHDIADLGPLGIVAVGYTSTNSVGGPDSWVVRLNAQGNDVQQQSFGSENQDVLRTVIATNGGYLAGGTKDRIVDWMTHCENGEAVLLDFNSNDELLDETPLSEEFLHEISSGFLVTGNTSLLFGWKCTSPSIYSEEAWMLSVNIDGSINWEKGLGSITSTVHQAVPGTEENMLYIVGNADESSGCGDKIGVWKYSTSGDEIWVKKFGAACDIIGYGIAATSNGGCLVLGGHPDENISRVVQLDPDGNLLWEKGYAPDSGTKCVPTRAIERNDGSIAVLGYCTGPSSQNGDVWIEIRSPVDGALLDTRQIGGTGKDSIQRIHPSPDGYYLVGYTESWGAKGEDGWIMHTDDDFAITCCTPDCDGKECGEDGCGGSCGECDDGDACTIGGYCVEQLCGETECPVFDDYDIDCNSQGLCEYNNMDNIGWKQWDVWIYVPPGSFDIGSPEGEEPGWGGGEQPKTKVSFEQGYLVAKYEIVVQQYEQCMAADPVHCTTPSTDGWDALGWKTNWSFIGREDHPQNGLTWYQSRGFCRWIAPGGHLPSEAEWEYAAKGPEHRKYPWGQTPEPTCENKTAVFDDGEENRPWACDPCTDIGCSGTKPVGSKPDGAAWSGALDMAGNVMEWVEDSVHYGYEGIPLDGSAWIDFGVSSKSERGGSFLSTYPQLRSAHRTGSPPNYQYATRGARCVRPTPAKECGNLVCPEVEGYLVYCNKRNHCEYANLDTTGPNYWDTWIYMPPGTFKIGSPKGLPDHKAKEDPETAVTFAEGFLISKYEVVVEQYEACVDAVPNGCTPANAEGASYSGWGLNTSANGRADHPQNGLTWQQSKDFCAWIAPGGHLASDAEWEYAAEGPDYRQYPWGNSPEPACSNGNAVFDSGGYPPGLPWGCDPCEVEGCSGTKPVGSTPSGASYCGAMNMAGNVTEWVEDDDHANLIGVPTDGKPWVANGTGSKGHRGGHFATWETELLRTAQRQGSDGEYKYASFGARCARPVTPPDCIPDCEGNQCGDDGCTGSCGECLGYAEDCVKGQCSSITFPCAVLGFDGVSSKVTVSDSPSLRPSSALSVAAWVRLDEEQKYSRIVTKDLQMEPSGGSFQLITGAADGQGHFMDQIIFTVRTDEGYFAAWSTVRLGVGKWSYVVGVFDGVAVSIYVNGKEAGSSSLAGGEVAYDTGPVVFGTDLHVPSPAFSGALHRAALWNKALSESEVEMRGLPEFQLQEDEGLVGLWEFSEGEGTPIADSSGLANDGMATAPEWLVSETPLPCPCLADCSGKECGDDGCGGLCSACSMGQECTNSQCVPTTTPTWTDPSSGLNWQNPPYSGWKKWEEAKQYCLELDIDNGGWHLPTIGELRTLIRGCPATEKDGSCNVEDDNCLAWSCRSTACDGCTPDDGPAPGGCYWPDEMEGDCTWYWSSSLDTDSGMQAWFVYFNYGDIQTVSTGSDVGVRCVRTPCIPNCDGKECGDDGCGGSCGECECAPGCASELLGDSFCDAACMVLACDYDGNDCLCAGRCGEDQGPTAGCNCNHACKDDNSCCADFPVECPVAAACQQCPIEPLGEPDIVIYHCPQKLTFDDAMNFCGTQESVDLAKLDTQLLLDATTTCFLGAGDAWIGLWQNEGKGCLDAPCPGGEPGEEWHWLDGTPLDVLPAWIQDEPNNGNNNAQEDCGELKLSQPESGKMWDAPCIAERSFICL